MKHIVVAETAFGPAAGQRSNHLASVKPVHRILTPFPVAYSAAALVTDLAYWRTAEVMWERFSIWLIAGGLVMSALVAIAALIDLALSQATAGLVPGARLYGRRLGFARERLGP